MADRIDMNSIAPEEYSEIKKQERADVFDLLSDASQKLLSPGRLKEYADKQAELFKHSVSNVLLIMEQDPEATWVRSYDDWKADGVTVLKGETGIKTLGSYRFQKEDGTMKSVFVEPMKKVGENSNEHIFSYEATLKLTTGGNFGYTFRVVPKHEMLLDQENLNLVKWIEK